MEVKIIHGGGEHVSEDGKREGSHVRLGWGRREAPLNGPVGLDGYSYGYRDKTGEKVTLSRPRPYGRPYGTGDVVGMYISIPPCKQANKKDPLDPAHIKRERIPIDLKGQEVFEMLEYPQSKEMTSLMDYSGKTTNSASVPSSAKKTVTGKIPDRGGPSNASKPTVPLRPLPTFSGSRIAFFVNGECQGTAFQDIYDYLQLRQTENSGKAKEKKRTREGVKEHRENPFNDGSLGYYPFISLFNDACVRLNPGPNFDFPPPADIDALLDNTESKEQTWRPTCERYPEFMAEQWALDAQEEQEASAEASKAAAVAKVEAEKKAARLKKRQETAARKRAKVEQGANLGIDDDRFGPGSLTPGLGQPSPLRHGTTYDAGEGSVNRNYSPAPTFMSNGEFQGGQSGYNSEMDQGNGEEHAYGGVHTEASSPTYIPQSPQGEYSTWVDPTRLSGPGIHVD
jgi:COMPASS component BRE2